MLHSGKFGEFETYMRCSQGKGLQVRAYPTVKRSIRKRSRRKVYGNLIDSLPAEIELQYLFDHDTVDSGDELQTLGKWHEYGCIKKFTVFLKNPCEHLQVHDLTLLTVFYHRLRSKTYSTFGKRLFKDILPLVLPQRQGVSCSFNCTDIPGIRPFLHG